MGIKNSTAPVSVEHTIKKDGDAWAHTSSSSNPPEKESPNGISSHSNGDITNVTRIVPESTTIMADWERIVQNFSKLNPISTLVMKRGVVEGGNNNVKKKQIYEIYETLTEEMLYRAEHQIQDWNCCCLLWGVKPILVYDYLDENEIGKLTHCTRVNDGISYKAIEVAALSTVIGYIHTLTNSTLMSYEITDDKRNKLFTIQRKTLGFKYAEYQVKTVSAIEVCVLVATVRTPREGKVFTEMRPSLSVTCKALIMSFSLYLLTLNE